MFYLTRNRNTFVSVYFVALRPAVIFTSIRRIAVREVCGCRRHGGPIEGSPETPSSPPPSPCTSWQNYIVGFKGALHYAERFESPRLPITIIPAWNRMFELPVQISLAPAISNQMGGHRKFLKGWLQFTIIISWLRKINQHLNYIGISKSNSRWALSGYRHAHPPSPFLKKSQFLSYVLKQMKNQVSYFCDFQFFEKLRYGLIKFL